MSVKSQMERLTQNIANAYAVLKALGCDMPSEQNSDNLASTAGTSKVVKYEAQSLTNEQKAQARTNIGAVSTEDFDCVREKIDNYSNVSYGTCSTVADVAEKVVTVDNEDWELKVGAVVMIKFTKSNSASNVKLNVNETGAYHIWYNNAEYTSTGTAYTGYANRVIGYMFNGTHWVWLMQSYDANTTYKNVSLGHGYATCSTEEATTAKVGTLSSYALTLGGIVAVKFTYAVPANATLNINSKGAKNIFYRGTKITAGVIKAGDIATFIYDGTQYQLMSIDRWQNDIVGKADKATTLAGYGITDGATKQEVTQLQQTVNNYVGVTIPDYWKEYIDGKESTIKALFDEGGVDAFPFLWGADIHGSKGASNSNGAGTSATKNIGLIARYTLDKYKVPYVLFSGDIHSQASHTSVESVEAEYEAIEEILSPIDEDELLMEKGNHDGAWGAPVDGVYYLKNIGGKKIYNRLFRRQSLDRNRVFGGDGSYFYVDSPQKVRIIMLNGHTDGDGSVDADGNAVYNSMKNGVYGTEQLKWLCEEALNVSEETRIIVSAHQPFSVSKDGTLLAGILEAYNKRTTYSGTKNVQADYWGKGVTDTTYTNISVNADFSEAKGKVVIYLHGHIHKDTIDTTTYSFAVASITTAGADVRDTDPPLRTPNTATETALDMIIMSKTVINFLRFGAGSDRVIALDDTIYYSIKNTLTNVKNSNSAGNIVAGNSYSATISANTGYELESVVVSIGGVDVTSSVYADGVITISEVTGNVIITASATKIETGDSTPNFTNLAQTVTTGKRLSSSGGLSDEANATTVEDYIEVTKGDVIRIKGFGALDDYNVDVYNSSKAILTANYPSNATDASYYIYTYDSSTEIATLVIGTNTSIKYIRVSGKLTGTTADVIITKNEEITYGGGSANTIPLTWLEGTTCTHTVGSACTVSSNNSYLITEEIPVEEGKTYTFNFNAQVVSSSKLKWVGVNDSGIVTEVLDYDYTGKNGENTTSFTPKAGTTKVRLRTYNTEKEYFISEKELKVSGGITKGYTNQIPISTDANGNVVGLIEGHRYNSSDTLVANAPTDATGFIPVKSGDTIYFKGIQFRNEEINGMGAGGYYLRLYDNSFTLKTAVSAYNFSASASVKNYGFVEGSQTVDAEGDITSIKIGTSHLNGNGYIRMTFVPEDGVEAVITVNEPIVDGGGSSVNYNNLADPTATGWVNNSRISSSGTAKEEGSCAGAVVTNYILVTQSGDFYIKGLDIINNLPDGNVPTHVRTSSMVESPQIGKIYGNAITSYATVSGDVTKINNSRVGQVNEYVRFTGTLLEGYSAEDVIITLNEPIE